MGNIFKPGYVYKPAPTPKTVGQEMRDVLAKTDSLFKQQHEQHHGPTPHDVHAPTPLQHAEAKLAATKPGDPGFAAAFRNAVTQHAATFGGLPPPSARSLANMAADGRSSYAYGTDAGAAALEARRAGREAAIQTGPRGGQYILGPGGSKNYLK